MKFDEKGNAIPESLAEQQALWLDKLVGWGHEIEFIANGDKNIEIKLKHLLLEALNQKEV